MEEISEKQKNFYITINSFIQKNKYFPTIGEIKKICNYKSYNTIYEYLDILTKKNYLIYNKKTKRISLKNRSYLNNNIITIPYINNNSYINVDISMINNKNNYIAYLINNNNLNSFGILYKDTVIINKDLKYLNNKLVLINYNNNYRILKYEKRNGFHHLFNDKENFVLENTNDIIGKVDLLIRSNF